MAQELIAFESDLKSQRAESKRFGVQLELLKSEQQDSIARNAAEFSQLERSAEGAKSRLRSTEQELRTARADYAELRNWRESQDSNSFVSTPIHLPLLKTVSGLDEQRSRFKAQTRELAAQIRYVKAKYTRESTFRNALSVQKRYLLLLVGGMSLKYVIARQKGTSADVSSEQATLKQIASMGYPIPAPPRQRRTLKAVSLTVIGIIRARYVFIQIV